MTTKVGVSEYLFGTHSAKKKKLALHGSTYINKDFIIIIL